jgi:hypothetical protein
MTQLIIRMILLLLPVFALMVGLIRAQPYQNEEVRAFLAPPEGCAPPCWQGIRPGITTLDEARSIVERYGVLQGPPSVQRWEWNGTSPSFIQSEIGRLVLWDGIVYQVELPNVVTLPDVLLTFGAPAKGRIRYDSMLSRRGMRYELYYPELGNLPLTIHGDCRTPFTQLTVTYSAREVNEEAPGADYDFPHWFYTYCH